MKQFVRLRADSGPTAAEREELDACTAVGGLPQSPRFDGIS